MFLVTVLLVFAASGQVSAGYYKFQRLNSANFSKTEGFKLTVNIVEEKSVSSLAECILSCIAEWPSCKSINYRVIASELPNCQLSTKIKDQTDPSAFVADSAFVYYENSHIMKFKSCLDYRRHGYTQDGLYKIIINPTYYTAYCDFTSEPNSAWTLIASFAFRNRNQNRFCSTPFTTHKYGDTVDKFGNLRLGIKAMTTVSQQSTHFRITTSYDMKGFSYRDYLRAKIADLDVLTFTGSGTCKTVERINIRGIEATNTGVNFWQTSTAILHIDSSIGTSCGFNAASGSISSEDNFGFYCADNYNTNFRGSENDNSTTNYWFGGYL